MFAGTIPRSYLRKSHQRTSNFLSGEEKQRANGGQKGNAPRPRLERSSILERRRAGIKALVTVGESDGSSAVLGGDDP